MESYAASPIVSSKLKPLCSKETLGNLFRHTTASIGHGCCIGKHMGFNQACGFQSATCSTHSNSSQCWNVSWDIWATYSAGGRGLCKCFVDSDLSWAHARCLLKNPVILWSRLGGGKCLTVLLFSLFLFMHMQWCHGGRFLDSLLVSGGFIWGFKAYCHFVCVCVCLNLSWM